jgi:hypothetical protein
VDLTQPDRMRVMIEAIIRHECGQQPYPRVVIDRAMHLAGLTVPGMPDAETPRT